MALVLGRLSRRSGEPLTMDCLRRSAMLRSIVRGKFIANDASSGSLSTLVSALMVFLFIITSGLLIDEAIFGFFRVEPPPDIPAAFSRSYTRIMRFENVSRYRDIACEWFSIKVKTCLNYSPPTISPLGLFFSVLSNKDDFKEDLRVISGLLDSSPVS